MYWPKKDPFNGRFNIPSECLHYCVTANRENCQEFSNKMEVMADVGSIVRLTAKAIKAAGFSLPKSIKDYPGPGSIKGPGDDLTPENNYYLDL